MEEREPLSTEDYGAAAAIAGLLSDAGIDCDRGLLMTTSEWQTAARIAGYNTPSQAVIDAVIGGISTRKPPIRWDERAPEWKQFQKTLKRVLSEIQRDKERQRRAAQKAADRKVFNAEWGDIKKEWIRFLSMLAGGFVAVIAVAVCLGILFLLIQFIKISWYL